MSKSKKKAATADVKSGAPTRVTSGKNKPMSEKDYEKELRHLHEGWSSCSSGWFTRG